MARSVLVVADNMENKADAAQLLEMATLQIKRMKGANMEQVTSAIADNKHPFWSLFERAVGVLFVPFMVGTLKSLTAFRMQIPRTERTRVVEHLAVGVNRIVYCDSSVISLGEFSLAVDAGKSVMFELTDPKGTQFLEAVSFVTNETGSDSKRQEVLLAQGRVFSPAQVGVLLGKAQKVEGRVDCPVTGLLMNGCANLLPVLAENGSVFRLDAYWFDDGWYVYVLAFGRSYRWLVEHRVLFRN